MTHVINPITRRKIKIGGPVYRRLLEWGIISDDLPRTTKKERAKIKPWRHVVDMGGGRLRIISKRLCEEWRESGYIHGYERIIRRPTLIASSDQLYIVNPKTNRKIRVNGRTYLNLLKLGFITGKEPMIKNLTREQQYNVKDKETRLNFLLTLI